MLSTDNVTIRVDTDGDLDTIGGRSTLIGGLEAAAQGASARILTFRGELFWDRSIGFPALPNAYVSNLDAVMGDRARPALAEAVFREQLLLTPAAAEVTFFALNFDPKTRTARPRWRLRFAFDDDPVSAEASGEAVLRG